MRNLGRETARQTMLSWALLFLFSIGVAGVASAQPDDRYLLTVGNSAGPSGGFVNVSIQFDMMAGTAGSPEPMLAWSYGVCHDPALVAVDSVTNGSGTATVNMGMPPAHNDIVSDPFGDGFYVAVIVDLFAAFSLPVGNHELNVATYELLGPNGSNAALSVCETLAFCDTCPIIPLAFDPVAANFSVPMTQPGTIMITDQLVGLFVRGECNADGQFNIADPVFLLSFLFPGPAGATMPPCDDACDANDDGALNIADAVALLQALFGGGMIPGPATCGVDANDSDSLTCNSFPPCP